MSAVVSGRRPVVVEPIGTGAAVEHGVAVGAPTVTSGGMRGLAGWWLRHWLRYAEVVGAQWR